MQPHLSKIILALICVATVAPNASVAAEQGTYYQDEKLQIFRPYPKSDKIVRNRADLIAHEKSPSSGSVLFMLSTGEDQDLKVVRGWMRGIESAGGKTSKSKYFSKYFWSADELIVEKGKFGDGLSEDQLDDVPKDYHCGFFVYIRAK